MGSQTAPSQTRPRIWTYCKVVLRIQSVGESRITLTSRTHYCCVNLFLSNENGRPLEKALSSWKPANSDSADAVEDKVPGHLEFRIRRAANAGNVG